MATYPQLYSDFISNRISIGEFIEAYSALMGIYEIPNGSIMSDQGLVYPSVTVGAPALLPYGSSPGASTFSYTVLPPSQPKPTPVPTPVAVPSDPRTPLKDREWVRRDEERVSHPYVYTKEQAAFVAKRIARDNEASSKARLYVFPWQFPINVGNWVSLAQPGQTPFYGKVYAMEYNATGPQCTKSVLVFPYDS
jgi:hypothetical protein